MKVLTLGAGAMGEAAAVTAASFQEIQELIVADISLDNAQRVAAQCGAKASAAQIDVTRHDDLVTLMRQADATLNCVGPFFRFGVPILEAAIAAGCHYFDICDDPEPTLAMLNMSDEAAAAGITAVIGAGASPGVTNLLARLAYESLDTVDELATAWNVEGPDDSDGELAFSMAIVHWMQQVSGTILEWRDQRLQDVPPLRPEPIHYPGRGDRTVWTVGHPEPISLSHTYPHLKTSYCAMVMSSPQVAYFRQLQQSIDGGKRTLEQAAQDLVAAVQRKSWLDNAVQTVSRWFGGPALPQFFALANGVRDGLSATTAASLRASPAGMAAATGIPLALTARLFAQGRISSKGVHAPEGVIDPHTFFDLLHPYCQTPCLVAREELVELVTDCRIPRGLEPCAAG